MNGTERGTVVAMSVLTAGALILIANGPGMLAVALAAVVIFMALLTTGWVRLAAQERHALEQLRNPRKRQNWREN